MQLEMTGTFNVLVGGATTAKGIAELLVFIEIQGNSAQSALNLRHNAPGLAEGMPNRVEVIKARLVVQSGIGSLGEPRGILRAHSNRAIDHKVAPELCENTAHCGGGKKSVSV